MPRYFTHYWKNDTWEFTAEKVKAEGGGLAHIAGNTFIKRGIELGDFVYIVSVFGGRLFIAGKLKVGRFCKQKEAELLCGSKLWPAREHILASEATPTNFDFAVPLSITRKLRFISNGKAQPLKFKPSNRLDEQTLRSVRELISESAAELDKFLPPLQPVSYRGKIEDRVEIELPEAKTIEHRISSGAGFGDPVKNREVERAAINFVISWYEQNGWNVSSVENKKCGYDLVCSKDKSERHVEVKGIRGSEEAFIITHGEVWKSKNDKNFVLCVVTDALSSEPYLTHYSGEDFLRMFELQEIAYRANLRNEYQNKLSASKRLRGALKFDNAPQTKEEVREMITEYLMEKYS